MNAQDLLAILRIPASQPIQLEQNNMSWVEFADFARNQLSRTNWNVLLHQLFKMDEWGSEWQRLTAADFNNGLKNPAAAEIKDKLDKARIVVSEDWQAQKFMEAVYAAKTGKLVPHT